MLLSWGGCWCVCVCVSPSPEGSRRRSADGRSPPGPAGSPGAVRGMLGQRPAPGLLPEPPRRSGHPSPGAPGVLPALPRGDLGVFPCAAPQKSPPRGSPKLSHPGGILGSPPLNCNGGAPPDSLCRGWGAPIPLPQGWGCFPGPAPLGTPAGGLCLGPSPPGEEVPDPLPVGPPGQNPPALLPKGTFPLPTSPGDPQGGGKRGGKGGGGRLSQPISLHGAPSDPILGGWGVPTAPHLPSEEGKGRTP